MKKKKKIVGLLSLIILMFLAVGCNNSTGEKVITIGETFSNGSTCNITVMGFENTNQVKDIKTDKNFVVISIRFESTLSKGQNALSTLKTFDRLTNNSTGLSIDSVYWVDENNDLIYSDGVRGFDNIIVLNLGGEMSQLYKVVFETDEPVANGNYTLSTLGDPAVVIPLK